MKTINRLWLVAGLLTQAGFYMPPAAASLAFPTAAEMEPLREAVGPEAQRWADAFGNTFNDGAIDAAIRSAAFYYPQDQTALRAVEFIREAFAEKAKIENYGSLERRTLRGLLSKEEHHLQKLRQQRLHTTDAKALAALTRRMDRITPRVAALNAELTIVLADEAREIKQTEISKLLRGGSDAGRAIAELEALGGTARRDGDVTARDVARVVAEEQNIPVSVAAESNDEKLARVERDLRDHLHGNAHVIDRVMVRLKQLVRGELPGPLRFLLEGPPGSGRTALGQILARSWYGKKFANESRLWLSPMPAHNWAEEIGWIARHPARHVSLDGFDEALPDAFNHLGLLFADEPMANLDNTILTAESNFTGRWATLAGAYPSARLEEAFGLEPGSLAGPNRDQRDQAVMRRHAYIPSYLTFAETLFFNPTTKPTAQRLISKFLEERTKTLWTQHAIALEIDSRVAPALADLVYDADQGGHYYDEEVRTFVRKGLTRFTTNQLDLPEDVTVKITVGDEDTFVFAGTFADGETKVFETQVINTARETPSFSTGLPDQPCDEAFTEAAPSL